MPFPVFVVGPTMTIVGWARDRHQSRRKVRLTVHRADLLGPGVIDLSRDDVVPRTDCYFVTVTNASRERDIVVTHVWLDTEPPIQILDAALPVRLRYSAPWEVSVPVANVPADPADVPWLARCMLSPDGKVVRSRPRVNVPPAGTVPRG